MPAICRDCLSLFETAPRPAAGGGVARCPACRSPRMLAHPELLDLSIAHMDCDAFYASVEKHDDPDLRDKPVIVGGGHRGVVSTCCYLARIRGVRSAMPMFQALKLCPEATVVRPRMSRYVAVSRQIRHGDRFIVRRMGFGAFPGKAADGGPARCTGAGAASQVGE